MVVEGIEVENGDFVEDVVKFLKGLIVGIYFF